MSQKIEYQTVVVARPFLLVKYAFEGQTAVGVESKTSTARGQKIKLELNFAREMIASGKAVEADSDEAKEILAELESAESAKKKA